MFVYGDLVYPDSNLAGIDPEKLYRATFICQYGLCCCIVYMAFVSGQLARVFWANGVTPPPPPPPLPTEIARKL